MTHCFSLSHHHFVLYKLLLPWQFQLPSPSAQLPLYECGFSFLYPSLLSLWNLNLPHTANFTYSPQLFIPNTVSISMTTFLLSRLPLFLLPMTLYRYAPLQLTSHCMDLLLHQQHPCCFTTPLHSQSPLHFHIIWFIPFHGLPPLQSQVLKPPNAHPLVCLQPTSLSPMVGALSLLGWYKSLRFCNRFLKDLVGILLKLLLFSQYQQLLTILVHRSIAMSWTKAWCRFSNFMKKRFFTTASCGDVPLDRSPVDLRLIGGEG